MPAFENSLMEGYTIEFDLQSTSDGVAIVMHDEELDRTTTCSGKVGDRTFTQIAADCRIDVLGSESVAVQLPPGDAIGEIPRLSEVINLLEKTGGKANIEVKDLAGEHPGFPADVYGQLEASDLSPNDITVQNFKSVDLLPAPGAFPGVTTSFLTITPINPFAVSTATTNGFDQVSPQWPIDAEFVGEARAAGLTVAPFTIDDAEGIVAADALGVDSIITNDPALADRLVGPKPKLRLQVVRGPAKARPGGTIKVGAFVLNAGKGQSDPGARVSIKFNRSSLKPSGPVSKKVPVLRTEEEHDTNFRVKVRRGAKKFGLFPVTLSLTGTGKPAINKVAKVKVLRPRK